MKTVSRLSFLVSFTHSLVHLFTYSLREYSIQGRCYSMTAALYQGLVRVQNSGQRGKIAKRRFQFSTEKFLTLKLPVNEEPLLSKVMRVQLPEKLTIYLTRMLQKVLAHQSVVFTFSPDSLLNFTFCDCLVCHLYDSICCPYSEVTMRYNRIMIVSKLYHRRKELVFIVYSICSDNFHWLFHNHPKTLSFFIPSEISKLQ